MPVIYRAELSDILNRWTVSVVIPVFNRQALGERAILSACAQAIEDKEIIVVDDGSDPPFRLPPAALQSASVRLVRHDVTCGASAARNSGIAAALGEWVALLDSDDYWLPATLESRRRASSHSDGRSIPRTTHRAPRAYRNSFHRR